MPGHARAQAGVLGMWYVLRTRFPVTLRTRWNSKVRSLAAPQADRPYPAIPLPQAGGSATGTMLDMGVPRLVKSIFVHKKSPVL